MNSIVTVDIHQLKILIGIASKLGATLAFTESGHTRRYLKKSEAFKIYGRKNVEEWIRCNYFKSFFDIDVGFFLQIGEINGVPQCASCNTDDSPTR